MCYSDYVILGKTEIQSPIILPKLTELFLVL